MSLPHRAQLPSQLTAGQRTPMRVPHSLHSELRVDVRGMMVDQVRLDRRAATIEDEYEHGASPMGLRPPPGQVETQTLARNPHHHTFVLWLTKIQKL